jgi:hypothetical protein
MASLKDILERAAKEKELAASGVAVLKPYVAPYHYQWLERDESEQDFSPEALKRAEEVLANKHKAKRTERFSASGLGKCPRRQLFSYGGVEQVPPSTQSVNIMRSGTAAHFWIMLEGLTVGWLLEAEVFYFDPDWRLGGTLDGVLSDASIWEYKSVASTKFTKVTTDKGRSFAENDPVTGADHDHLLQCDSYELLTGMKHKSLFYEDRNYGEFHEYRLGEDTTTREQLLKLLDRLNTHVDDNTLPPMLEECERRVGNVYNECPYRKVCASKTTLFD